MGCGIESEAVVYRVEVRRLNDGVRTGSGTC